MEKIWKKIHGYENYSVSNIGEVRIDKSGKLFSLKPRQSGYVEIGLSKNNKRKKILVHKLVAKAFIENPENKPTVHHVNEIKNDNRVENLEWQTVAEQNRYHSKKRRGKNSLAGARGVWRCDSTSGIEIEYYQNIRLAAEWVRKNNGGIGNAADISTVALGKKKVVFGFSWKYKEVVDLPGEIWIPLSCINTETHRISNFGRIINQYGRLARPYKHLGGYYRYTINWQKYQVHVLVAKAFLPNNDLTKTQVNHKDGNKDNYFLDNLEWSTPAKNMQHAVDIGLVKSKKIKQMDMHGNLIAIHNNRKEASKITGLSKNILSKLCNNTIKTYYKKVKQLDLNDELIKIHKNCREAAKETGFKEWNILKCCSGKQEIHKNFKWQYEQEYKFEYVD